MYPKLTVKSIREQLRAPHCEPIAVETEVVSTNDWATQAAIQGAPHGAVFVADVQTGGRGRNGHRFVSPRGHGVYLSMVLRPKVSLQEVLLLTAAAAVAVCRAIETVADCTVQIKWPNDLFVDGRKVCGILTELAVSPDDGGFAAVLGVGINFSTPKESFPEEVREIAGSLLSCLRSGSSRAQLIARLIEEVTEVSAALPGRAFLPEYRRRSFLLGRQVNVTSATERYPATALDITQDGGLQVCLADGSLRELYSSGFSVRLRGE